MVRSSQMQIIRLVVGTILVGVIIFADMPFEMPKGNYPIVFAASASEGSCSSGKCPETITSGKPPRDIRSFSVSAKGGSLVPILIGAIFLLTLTIGYIKRKSIMLFVSSILHPPHPILDDLKKSDLEKKPFDKW